MSRGSKPLELRDGASVAVVGGGPAGALFACQLLRGARERGLGLEVVLYEPKRFAREGPQGCNMGAGVICSELLERLAEIGIELSGERVQRVIDGYRLHTRAGQFRMSRAASQGSILAVYRGGGPRGGGSHAAASFDALLLERALGLGARLDPRAVDAVEPSAGQGGPATVAVRADGGTERVEADLVAVACGINAGLAARLEQAGIGYRRPRAQRAAQAAIPLPEAYIDAQFGSNVHVFSLGLKRVRFAALVPKRQAVTLTLIGRGDLGGDDLRRFVQRPEVLELMPAGWAFSDAFCCCFPRMPVSPARRPFADRLVVIGDAAVSRYYKNGLGSAYTTSALAARTALEAGVSARAFGRGYWRTAKRQIARDNLYGRAMFAVGSFLLRFRPLEAVYFDVSYRPPERRGSRRFHFINWNLITGDRPYRAVALALLSPAFVLDLLGSAARVAGRWVRSLFRPSQAARATPRVVRPRSRLGPLRDGQTVAIVGGGPAGASCAIALKHLAAERGIALNVLLYEARDLESQQQFNPCAGVVSPPIVEVLEKHLGVPFPHHLVQRKITEYLFRGKQESIRLVARGQPSLAMRRVQFDRHLFREAAARGAQVVRARVHDMEITPYEVRVFSESSCATADVVVGAFGLDSGSADAFRRATGYRPPPCIETLITNLHPPPEQMARHGQTAYAMLPPIPGVEFAAAVPKGNHLTIVVAGRDLRTEAMDELLAWGPFREIVAADECRETTREYYKGRFPSAKARYIFGERYVTVGDASGLVRPFKGKGITTACLTGEMAAQTLMEVGISESAMRRFYADCQPLAGDILYGRIVRWLVRVAQRSGAIDDLIRQAHQDRAMRDAMYCCVSGEGAFRDMLVGTFGLGRLWRVAKPVIRGLFTRPSRR